MNTFIVRITEPEVRQQILKQQDFDLGGLNRFKERIVSDDLVFIYLGGDTGKVDWEPGFWGFGKVTRAPFNFDDKNFTISIHPVQVLSSAIPIKEGKLHHIYRDILFDEAPYVGANHFPTQAISEVGPNGVNALWLMLEEKDKTFRQYVPQEANLLALNLRKEKNKVQQQSVTNAIPKPFFLLAGISGTGKTKWVRDQKIDGINNVSIIPVRPDWHEPSDLLGYISRVSGSPVFVSTPFLSFLIIAWKDAYKIESTINTSAANLSNMMPHWLCLDEMNLAPVEQYFADYLSIIEQRDWDNGLYSCPPILHIDEAIREPVRQSLHFETDDPLWIAFTKAGGIPLPPNLIVVGTVNMDETTHGFSRKVLDRAITIEFDAVDFSKYGGTAASNTKNAIPWTRLSPFTKSDDVELNDNTRLSVLDFLERWNAILDQTSFRIAYRTINESLLIANSLSTETIEQSLDWIAMTKLLPRLEGDENKLGMDREGNEKSYIDELETEWSVRFGEFWETSRTKRKIDFMRGRLKRSGYTSFWP